jgi:hypothetical protein
MDFGLAAIVYHQGGPPCPLGRPFARGTSVPVHKEIFAAVSVGSIPGLPESGKPNGKEKPWLE